jgi:hypothetical protein
MKAFQQVLIGVALVVISLSTQAAGRALGTDFIRMLDHDQPVGGSFNVMFQRPTQTGKTMVFHLALADNDDFMFEVGLKRPAADLSQGLFYQLGVALVDQRNNSDIGFSAALGYEQATSNNLTFFGSVKTLYIPNNGFNYSPVLGVLWAF